MNFTPDFLRAVVNALLPGLPESDHAAALLAASQIGVDRQLAQHWANHSKREQLSRILQAIAEEAGDMSRFVAADEETATAILRKVELADSPTFQVFLFVVSADYYESEEVLRAFGWPTHPPQPQGYPLPPFDEELLRSVKAREKLWRSVG